MRLKGLMLRLWLGFDLLLLELFSLATVWLDIFLDGMNGGNVCAPLEDMDVSVLFLLLRLLRCGGDGVGLCSRRG